MKLSSTLALRLLLVLNFAAAWLWSDVDVAAGDDDEPVRQGAVAIKLTLVPSTPEVPVKQEPTGSASGGEAVVEAKDAAVESLAVQAEDSDSAGHVELTQFTDRRHGFAGRSLKNSDKPSVKRLWVPSTVPGRPSPSFPSNEDNEDASTSTKALTDLELADDSSQPKPARQPDRLQNDRPVQRLALTGPDGRSSRSSSESNTDTNSEAGDRQSDAPSSRGAGRGSKVIVDASRTKPAKPMPGEESVQEELGECPGGPDAGEGEIAVDQEALRRDDVPLVQEEHPYDAPPARSTGKTQTIVSRDGDLNPADIVLRDRIQRVLAHFLTHPENTSRRGPWALMHAALPFGVETEIEAGNRRVNALGWMCYNGVCAKQRVFQPTKQGFRTNVGPGVQGHEGQFLAILAQSRVQPDYPILIGNRRYNIMDLVKYEMATCREKSELTFKLIGLSHYLEPDQRWRDNQGKHWNLEKMVAEELAQPVIGAACGGTHRLMGLSFALIRREQAGLPLSGHWQRAEIFINDFVSYAISLQNPDGSFSTNWFEGRGDEDDIERKLQTSGHIVEWLVYTLPDDQLRSPRIQKAVEFLAQTLDSDLRRDWPIGPRGHALRAMALYHQRLYGGEPGQMRQVLTASRKNGPIK